MVRVDIVYVLAVSIFWIAFITGAALNQKEQKQQMIKEKEVKNKYWEAEYEKVLTSIATIELRLATLETIPDTEIVGSTPLSSKLANGTQSMKDVTAKEVKDECIADLAKKVNIKNALERLLNY